MVGGGVGLLLLGAAIGLRVEEARDVSPGELDGILEAAASAIERRSGRRAVLDPERGPAGCGDDARCLAGARERTGAGELIVLRMFGVPTRIRIAAARIGGAGETIATATADLARPREGWERSLDGLAMILLPDAAPPVEATAPRDAIEAPPAALAEPPPEPAAVPPEPATQLAAVAPAPDDGPDLVLPLAVAGASAVAAAVGIAFGVLSANAEAEGTMPRADGRLRTPAEDQALLDAHHDNGLAANVLFSVAGAGVLTSLVLYLVQ